jgi:hypothetical protein
MSTMKRGIASLFWEAGKVLEGAATRENEKRERRLSHSSHFFLFASIDRL